MKHTSTAGALALSAFALAACSDSALSTAEKQEQLDAAFTEIDALPEYTQDRFQEFSDPEGNCGVAYKDRERGVQITTSLGRMYGAYNIQYHLPQMVRVDCADLNAAFESVRTTLAVAEAEKLLGRANVRDHQREAMNDYKAQVTDGGRSDEKTNIQSFGLK